MPASVRLLSPWRALAMALLTLVVAACSGVARPDDAWEQPADVITQVEQRVDAVESLRLVAKGDYWDTQRGERIVGRPVTLLASAPDALRVQVGSGFGSVVGALASDGERFTMLDMQSNVFYQGPATADNLSRLLPLYLPGVDLVTVLRGGFPTSQLAPDWRQRAALEWNRDAGRYRLILPRLDGQTQRVELTHPALAVAEIAILNAEGDPVYRYEARDFIDLAPGTVPEKSRFELPGDSIDVTLRLEAADSATNVDLPPEVFVIEPPPGLEQVTLP